MLSKYYHHPVKTPIPNNKYYCYYSALPYHQKKLFFKILCCDKNGSNSPSPPPQEKKMGIKLAGKSLADMKLKLNDFDRDAVQESVSQWLSKTQSFLNGVTSPFVKGVNDGKPHLESFFNGVTSPLVKGATDRKPQLESDDDQDVEDIIVTEQTVDCRTPGGDLSEAAIVSIEQFSRMNGSTGQKMQKIFKSLVSESVHNNPRNLVEYCCFRFLSRNGPGLHPGLKEPAFQRLIFVTMLAWENPSTRRKDSWAKLPRRNSFQFNLKKKLVGEEAFVRFAPAVSGVADYPTVHNLFKALAGQEYGISFSIWSTYINELVKVHDGRKSCQFRELCEYSEENVLCLGSGRKQPVIKWEKNMAWPGKLTLTDRGLYFEAAGLTGEKDAVRVDLTSNGSKVVKTKVGPFGSNLFDSAISVKSGLESEPLVLEFVDLGGEMRRDVWYAFIKEVIAVYQFIREYGPEDGDMSVHDVYGAHKGKESAVTYAVNAIARLQALQFMKRTLDEPTKLVPFSYLQNAPYGDIVLQTLAVNFWGGPLTKKLTVGNSGSDVPVRLTGEVSEIRNHVYDIDGSVYLRKWMRSASWYSSASLTFWKNTSVRGGIVLAKDLVVAETTLVEKAAVTCRDRYRVAEKTQATIDAAMIEGIPSNIDLFKELVLPLTLTVKNFDRLRRWDDPLVTASFLGFTYTLIFRNLLSYVFPVALMFLASSMLLLKGLKEQGRLGRFFGKVTIHDQPPSNTIQKIIALKGAMREVEIYLQNINVVLLKIRSVLLAGNPQITTEVALVLLLGSTALLLVPFKYILACVTFDIFTRELEFRREMVLAFTSFLKERWNAVPAAPVVVLPYEEKDSESVQKKQVDKVKSERTQSSNE